MTWPQMRPGNEKDEWCVRYCVVQACPLCGGEGRRIGSITRESYQFGAYSVPFPRESGGQISLKHCEKCDLVFKEYVPLREDLTALYREAAKNVWNAKRHAYTHEREIIRRLLGTGFDVIDIGSAKGEVLQMIGDLARKKSALDVTENEECLNIINGEYLIGFIEDASLDVGKHQYDLVTAFDVLEHLYDPRRAFENVVRLLKRGGYVIAETGDHGAVGQLNDWWYLGFLEHHICWSTRSLVYAAESCGLDVISIKSMRHKGRRYMPWWKQCAVFLIHVTGRIAYVHKMVQDRLGMDSRLVGNPFVKDHLFTILRKA